ncbi:MULTISPECIES: MFS transporter [unclassified Streptomyces]|uniref:MFS transporter n=1 Tax=unclassified Streptomyces TaxID=2593676 RepID=UPI00380E68D9
MTKDITTAAPVQPSPLALRIFLGGQSVSLMGDGLAILAIPLLVLQVSGSPYAAVLAAIPRTVGYLLVGLPAGALVDRLNPRNVMLAMDAVRFGVFLSLALLAATSQLRVPVILALAFVAAGAGVFFETALTVAVRDLVAEERLVRTNSLLEAANQGAQIVGPGLVGVLSALWGLQVALVVNACTFAVSFATVLHVLRGRKRTNRAPSPPLKEALRGVGGDLAEGFRCLRSLRVVLLVTCLQASANLFLAVGYLLVFYLRDTLHLGTSAASAVVAAGGAGGVLGAAVAVRLGARMRHETLIALSAAGLGVALASLGVATSLVPLLLLNLLLGCSTVTAVVLIRSLRQRLVPRPLLGRVTATAKVAALAASPVGALAGGALTTMNHGDPRPVFMAAGVLSVLTTAAAWTFGLRGGTHRPPDPAQRPGTDQRPATAATPDTSATSTMPGTSATPGMENSRSPAAENSAAHVIETSETRETP